MSGSRRCRTARSGRSSSRPTPRGWPGSTTTPPACASCGPRSSRACTAMRRRDALADPPDFLALVVRWVQARRAAAGPAAPPRRRLRRGGGPPRRIQRGPAPGGRVPGGRHSLPSGARRPISALTRGGVRLRNMAVDVVYRDLALEDLGPPARPRALRRLPRALRCRGGAAGRGRASSARKGCWSTSGAPRRRASSRPASAVSSRRVCRGHGCSARRRDRGSGRPPDRPAGVRAARRGSAS